MGPKLLFGLGIVLAHGAMAAGWLAREAPQSQARVVSTCTHLPPAQLPHFTPPGELLAQAAMPVVEVVRP
jgi:hypothetical protein